MTLLAAASVAPNSAPAAQYHQKTPRPSSGAHFTASRLETQVRAWFIRAISKVGLFESRQSSGQPAFREPSRKTVVSK
jgi:hypothetical protein